MMTFSDGFDPDKIEMSDIIDLACVLIALKCGDGLDALLDILPRPLNEMDFIKYKEERPVWLDDNIQDTENQLNVLRDLCIENKIWMNI